MQSGVVTEGENSRLKHFPIMFFAIIMGFSGLAIVYQKAGEILGVSPLFGEVLVAVDSILFLIIFSFYLLKLISHTKEVSAEFVHPIRVNFFAALSISLMLLSIVYHEISHQLSYGLFVAGVVLHSFFTLYTIRFWINHNFEIAHSNPAWFIPIVGNVLVPVAGAGLADNEFLMFYFSLGMFFWIVLFTIVFYRIIFHHQLAQKFMPTLFIFIAPPAIGFIAYVKLGYGLDFFGHFLLDLGLFFTFLLFFMYKNFIKLKFFISWWAFTFPLAAITIATMLAYKMTNSLFYSILSYILVGVTTFVVLYVAYQTIIHMSKKEICIAE